MDVDNRIKSTVASDGREYDFDYGFNPNDSLGSGETFPYASPDFDLFLGAVGEANPMGEGLPAPAYQHNMLSWQELKDPEYFDFSGLSTQDEGGGVASLGFDHVQDGTGNQFVIPRYLTRLRSLSC